MTRFELVTSSLPRKRSTPELHRRKKRERDRVRTGDIQLGRFDALPKLELLALYRKEVFSVLVLHHKYIKLLVYT